MGLDMKAAVCRDIKSPLSLETLSLGDAPQGEMRLRVISCSICHSDINYIKGKWASPMPFLAGHEVAGIVEQVGEGVVRFKVGDRVISTLIRSCGSCNDCHNEMETICSDFQPISHKITDSSGAPVEIKTNMGGFAEQVIVHERQCVKLPDDVDFDIGAVIGCGVITGFGSVMRAAKVRGGENVGIVGAGGVGINAIQAAHVSGAENILAIDTAEMKQSLFTQMGATGYINPKAGDTAEAVHAANGGRGLDIVFVGVGLAKAIEDALPMVRKGGKVIVMGMPASDDIAKIDMASMVADSKSIIGVKMGATSIDTDIPKIIELNRQGKLNLENLISHRYPFEDINTAIETTMTPEAKRVVLQFPSNL